MANKSEVNTDVTGHFLDSSKLNEIQKWRPVITGLTTNPVILQKDGVVDIPAHLRLICQTVGPRFPVSVEIPDTQMSQEEMLGLAHEYVQQFPANAVIKVPITDRGLNVIHKLAKEGVPINATLGITFSQLALAADAGADFVSLFWGRALESKEKYNEGPGPEVILESTLTYLLTRRHTDVRVIVGSIRTPDQVRQALAQGAHIVTPTPGALEQSMQAKRLAETIEQFNRAYHEAKQDPNFKLV